MLFWLNKRKLDNFLHRPPMSDEDFLNHLNLSSKLFTGAIKDYRLKLSEMFLIPPENIYPNDSFKELFSLPTPSNWELLEIVLSLEEVLEVEIDDTKLPEWQAKMFVGQWIKELLLKCFP